MIVQPKKLKVPFTNAELKSQLPEMAEGTGPNRPQSESRSKKSCFSQACIWKGIIHFSVDFKRSLFSHLGGVCVEFVEVQTNQRAAQ